MTVQRYPAQVPLECKLRMSIAQGAGGVGVQTRLLADVELYNDGYTYNLSGGYLVGVVVPDAGRYRAVLQCGVLANSQYLGLQLVINGTTALPDGSQAPAVYGGPASLTNPFIQVEWEGALAAGDEIGAVHWQGPGPQNLFANYTVWNVSRVLRGRQR